jgi:hypothetical protein
MQTFVRKLIAPTLLLCVAPLSWSQVNKACQPTPITDKEAVDLLYAVPVSVYTLAAGSGIIIEPHTDENYPPSRYWVVLLVSKDPSLTPLGSDIMDYLAVDRRSADVTSLTALAPVRGKELEQVQRSVRQLHCIGRNTSKKAK